MAGEWDAAATFKFAIGDVVEHKAWAGHPQRCARFVVVSLWVERCHGGFQRHYGLTTADEKGGYVHRCNEDELVAAGPLKVTDLATFRKSPT